MPWPHYGVDVSRKRRSAFSYRSLRIAASPTVSRQAITVPAWSEWWHVSVDARASGLTSVMMQA